VDGAALMTRVVDLVTATKSHSIDQDCWNSLAVEMLEENKNGSLI
jgi:hypothetical protein